MKNPYLLIGLIFLSLIISSYAVKENPAVVSKTLVFPVLGNKSNVGSVFGDARDGGARKHEGIDIFAAKGTPVIAICDGVVLDVSEDEIGGKTVTFESNEHPWRAYYAHLDRQDVYRGQLVNKGQVLGTVGNTGNARTTPSHLHFGIYTEDGAIDPLPYVKSSPKLSSPNDAAPHKTEPVIAKTTSKRTVTKNNGIPPAIKTAAASAISKLLMKKIGGVFNVR